MAYGYGRNQFVVAKLFRIEFGMLAEECRVVDGAELLIVGQPTEEPLRRDKLSLGQRLAREGVVQLPHRRVLVPFHFQALGLKENEQIISNVERYVCRRRTYLSELNVACPRFESFVLGQQFHLDPRRKNIQALLVVNCGFLVLLLGEIPPGVDQHVGVVGGVHPFGCFDTRLALFSICTIEI